MAQVCANHVWSKDALVAIQNKTKHVWIRKWLKFKNSLKKSLNEIKENKENLMIESNIVEKRFNFIVEGKTFDTEQDQNYLIESIISEIGYLKTQGYNSQAINEGLFSMLGGLLGGAFKSTPQVFGEYVAGWLMKTLGVPENSYIASSIQALVGNLNISDYDRMFSDCRFASNKIADSLIEGYVLQLQKQKDLSSGAGGFIISALRNSVRLESFLRALVSMSSEISTAITISAPISRAVFTGIGLTKPPSTYF